MYMVRWVEVLTYILLCHHVGKLRTSRVIWDGNVHRNMSQRLNGASCRFSIACVVHEGMEGVTVLREASQNLVLNVRYK